MNSVEIEHWMKRYDAPIKYAVRYVCYLQVEGMPWSDGCCQLSGSEDESAKKGVPNSPACYRKCPRKGDILSGAFLSDDP